MYGSKKNVVHLFYILIPTHKERFLYLLISIDHQKEGEDRASNILHRIKKNSVSTTPRKKQKEKQTKNCPNNPDKKRSKKT